VTVTSKPTPTEAIVPERRSGMFTPFRYRDYRLLWMGLLVSNFGTWMQFTALGYFVVSLAPTARLGAFEIGLLGASRALPVLLLSPFAGVVADRFPRKRILLTTNVVNSVLALALALVSSSHHATLGLVFLISGLQAGTQAFDAPARQSWVPLLVPREYVGNAIGLNSLAFNGPSVLGPPVAGFLIAATGVAPSFYINAAATLAVLIALVAMKPSPPVPSTREPFLRSITGGVTMLFAHPVLRWIILLLIVTSLLLRPYNFLLPAYAAHVVHVDAKGLGWLMAAAGFGAIGGAVLTAAYTGTRRSGLWFWSGIAMALGVILLGVTQQFFVAVIALAIIGMSSLTFIGCSNILIQTLSPDEMRGRAVAVYSMVLLGLIPAGSLLVGSIAAIIGLHEAFIIAGIVCVLVSIWMYMANPRLREA